MYTCSCYKRRCWFCSEALSPLLGCLVPLYFCSNSTLGMCSEGLVEVGSLSAFTEEKKFNYSCKRLKWWPASLSSCCGSSFQVCVQIWVETCQKEESSLVSPCQPGFLSPVGFSEVKSCVWTVTCTFSMFITRSKAGEPASTTSPSLQPLTPRISPLLAQVHAGEGVDPQDEGSSQRGCSRDVPFGPLAGAHALAACLIQWFCIFRCFLM